MTDSNAKMKKMNILVVNDDGIEAVGIRELVRALHEEAGADVYVVAPDGQRSAASHAITLLQPIEARPAEFENAELAYAISGHPSDCVVVVLKILKDKGIPVDMVFSGINHGSNVGTDTVYSGTVAAALEGSIQGYPSVAVSVDSHQPVHFDFACRMAVDVIAKTAGKWDSGFMLNLNAPDIPAEEIKGVLDTVIGKREYSNDIRLTGTNGDVLTYRYGGDAVRYEGEPLVYDVIAIQNGYASVTPLHKDMTAHHAKAEVESWRIGR